jgi:predicted ATPase/DNA-binding SARP family transcriptional activator
MTRGAGVGVAARGGSRVPLSLSVFVGRQRELAELKRLLESHRLVTLTGAAGSGKTRLAAEAVRGSGGIDAVWVELGALGEGGLVAGQVAAVLGARHVAGTDVVDTLVTAIGGNELLLVLDNCEHVIDACAELSSRLLQECASLRILATSRQPLGIAGERSRAVPPLSLPARGAVRIEDAAEAEAVQLFAQRAADVVPGFTLTAANLDAVVRICRRVDGLPLAIELAAARVKLLPPEQLVRRLDDVFSILTTGARTTLPRHRTLRALLDWSYDLLEPQEQRLLRRLSVFAGGFTLDAAESVPAMDDIAASDVLDLLASLVDRSLVVMRERAGDARYALLETVQQYAHARALAEDDDAARLRLGERHARYYVALAADAAEQLHGAEQLPALGRLDAEHDNLRAALGWSVAQRAAAPALELCIALHDYWALRGFLTEGRRWLEDALALDGPPGQLARVMTAVGRFARLLGEHDVARSLHARAVELARRAGDAGALAEALTNLGAELALHRDVDAARGVLDEAVSLRRELGSAWALSQALSTRASLALTSGDAARARELRLEAADVSRRAADRDGEARALVGLGEVARLTGEWEAARAYNQRAIALFRELGETWHVAAAVHNLGWIAAALGESDAALGAFAEMFELLTSVGNRRIAGGLCLAGLAHVLHARGESVLAARALGTAQRAFAAVGIKPAAADQRQWDDTQRLLRTALGAEGFDAAWSQDLPGDVADAARRLLDEARRGTHMHDAAPVDVAVASSHTDDFDEQQPAAAVVTAEPRGADLRVEALGALRVWRDGVPITQETWGSARPRELLLYLLAAPAGRTREQVGVTFWPESTSAQVSNSFHVALYRLRKALAHPEWVVLHEERYRIAPHVLLDYDVARFEHAVTDALRSARAGRDAADALDDALALYRGDFLEHEAPGSWAMDIRDRLQRLYGDGLMTLGGLRLAQGRTADAATAFRTLIARDELHEAAYRGLMQCYAADGQRTEALRLFARLRDVLRTELDSAPDPATLALHQQLQQADA